MTDSYRTRKIPSQIWSTVLDMDLVIESLCSGVSVPTIWLLETLWRYDSLLSCKWSQIVIIIAATLFLLCCRITLGMQPFLINNEYFTPVFMRFCTKTLSQEMCFRLVFCRFSLLKFNYLSCNDHQTILPCYLQSTFTLYMLLNIERLSSAPQKACHK